MAPAEERLAAVEVRVDEHARGLTDVRSTVASLERRMDQRFDSVDRRFENIDRRFAGIDKRFEALDGKLSTYFLWIVGFQITTLIAVIAALAAR